MISHKDFDGGPWTVRQSGTDLDVLAQTESVFALSNGHIGLRGNLDEGEPCGLPGTYLNGFHEHRPLPYAEAGYGYPSTGQTIVDVADGKILRVLVNDEPLDLRYGTVEHHERSLNLQTGILERDLVWRSPDGVRIRLQSSRLVSFEHRAVAAIDLRITALEQDTRIVVQSELLANQPVAPQSKDPRAAAALANALEPVHQARSDLRAVLAHRTRRSELLVVALMDHEIDARVDVLSSLHVDENIARLSISTELNAGEELRVRKYLAYGWSSQRSLPALSGQVEAALVAALRAGWDGLAASQREYLEHFWAGAAIEIDGDRELERAIRFALFQLLQASVRAERRAIPAKGLTGPGYDGHTFWDTEAFVLPVLTYVAPQTVADALRWRHGCLEQAKELAAGLGLQGAAFPWRTIDGRETSAYWPAGTAAFHVSADVAAAAETYLTVNKDDEFAETVALELAVQTARMWMSLGDDGDERFEINGVTGPDEYSAVADNNTYTNLMVQRNLRFADRLCTAHTEAARELHVSPQERKAWRSAADRIVIPYDESRGLHHQSERFLDHGRLDFDALSDEDYPLLLSMPYVRLYSTQVVKQADLVLAMWSCGEAFSDEQKRRNFDYYESITVRDSSLSSGVQAILAAEVGHLELAYDHLAEAALIDLEDRQHNTRDGLHLASLASAWLGVVAGLGGMREHDGLLHFRPRLPDSLERLRFHVRFGEALLEVTVTSTEACYELIESNGALPIAHEDEMLNLSAGQPVTVPVTTPTASEEPPHPRGRRPRSRVSERDDPAVSQ